MAVQIYRIPIEKLKEAYREYFGAEPRAWMCPCSDPNCEAGVVYVRALDGRVCFQANQTVLVQPPYPTMVIDNVEDIGLFLTSKILPPVDIDVFRQWFGLGLKEAILSA